MSLRHIRRARAARADVERSTQAQILELLEAWRIPARAMVTGVRNGAGARQITGGRGVPDILGWLPWGQALAIEVKREKGGLRPAQAEWILETARLSPYTMIMLVTSMDEVKRVLEPLVQRWREPNVPDYPIAELWQMVSEGGPGFEWRMLRCEAKAAAEDVLEKERARPRPGVPANLL